jgi:hypothetical protein
MVVRFLKWSAVLFCMCGLLTLGFIAGMIAPGAFMSCEPAMPVTMAMTPPPGPESNYPVPPAGPAGMLPPPLVSPAVPSNVPAPMTPVHYSMPEPIPTIPQPVQLPPVNAAPAPESESLDACLERLVHTRAAKTAMQQQEQETNEQIFKRFKNQRARLFQLGIVPEQPANPQIPESPEPPLGNGPTLESLIDSLKQIRSKKAALEATEKDIIEKVWKKVMAQDERLMELQIITDHERLKRPTKEDPQQAPNTPAELR